MKLNLPKQNPPTAETSPNQPRKLKKVLSALPNSNMGELTKQTYFILRDLNRQAMPNKHRLENLEMLQTLTRDILNNLKKYFVDRTLPLPDKSQKIINLNQSILQELIYGYEIIAYEAANKIGNNVGDKTLSIAICRAINYLSEMLLRCYEVYALCPKNLWRDAHQLYMFAESKNITGKTVLDRQEGHEKTTIEDSYKQILLFSLARPFALRQSDSKRVYKELFEWSKYASIHREVSENLIDRIFRMRVNEDSAPNYLSKNDLAEDITVRTLDTSKLVSHIKNLVAEQNEQEQKLAVGDTIPLETLNTLISSWGESAKRRFPRAEQRGHINVVIGLSQAAKAIGESDINGRPVDTKYDLAQTSPDFIQSATEKRLDPDFTLESIDNQEHDANGYITHTEIGSDENNAWDMVAKGRTLTDTYVKEQKLRNEEQFKLHQQDADSHWEIVNISAGGYCLRWNSDDTSKARVGEIIALQQFDAKNNFEWRIGVIRWMQFTRKNGLEIGVQVLSPKVITASIQRVNRPDEAPFECLMLPEMKALNQVSTTILPSHAFKTNDKLVVQVLENKLIITLAETGENSGSFTQFTYKYTGQDPLIKKQMKKEEVTKNKDDLDGLWASL